MLRRHEISDEQWNIIKDHLPGKEGYPVRPLGRPPVHQRHLFGSPKFYQLIQQMINPMIREIEHLKQEGLIRKDIDCVLAGYLLMGMADYGAWLVMHRTF